jgi:hypothetical protein
VRRHIAMVEACRPWRPAECAAPARIAANLAFHEISAIDSERQASYSMASQQTQAPTNLYQTWTQTFAEHWRT